MSETCKCCGKEMPFVSKVGMCIPCYCDHDAQAGKHGDIPTPISNAATTFKRFLGYTEPVVRLDVSKRLERELAVAREALGKIAAWIAHAAT